MISRRAKHFLSVLILLVSLWACQEKPYYEAYQSLNEEGWHSDSLASFELEVEDTLSAYRIVLNFRANNSYPYSNLYLFRNIYADEQLEYRDTVNFILADPYGKWLGDGLGDLKSFERLYRRQPLRFKKKGSYRFELEQAMREDPLPGIKDIGISIYKVKDGQKEN